jgi:hypothetical protein
MLSVCSAHWRCRRRPFQVRSGSSLFFSNPFRLSLVCCAHWRHLADPRIDMILFIILSSLLAFWQARVKGHGETDRLERPQYVGRSRLLPGVVSGCQGRSRRGWSSLMNSLIGYRIYLLRRRHSPVRGSMNEHYLDEHCLGKRRKETFTRKISFRRRQDIHGEAVYQREPRRGDHCLGSSRQVTANLYHGAISGEHRPLEVRAVGSLPGLPHKTVEHVNHQ